MKAIDYIRTEEGFNTVADLIQAPLGNLHEDTSRMMPLLRGPGVLKKAFESAKHEWMPVKLDSKEIFMAKRAIDIFIHAKMVDLPMHLGSKIDRVVDLVNLRLSEGLDGQECV
jgi:hypothetical protein